MLIEKLQAGVLKIMTPIGPRYVRLTILDRVSLLWAFRHFTSLPLTVLNQSQRNRIEGLCAAQAFTSIDAFGDALVIGTIEQQPMPSAAMMPARRPMGTVTESNAIHPLASDASR